MKLSTIGPYTIEGEIARGAMGVVFRATDPSAQRKVAIKVLHRAGSVDRFAREAQALAKLSHPGIVTIHTAGEHEGRPYLVMQLVEGDSLQHRIDRHGPLPADSVARLGQALAEALSCAHDSDILHRDLKPANVLLASDGSPLLTDFGLARDVTAPASSLTKTGVFMGTPGYWPPEQAAGKHQSVGIRSDVYSLGATLYAALTGQAPILGDTIFETLMATARRPPRPPSELQAGIPRDLERVVLRCLEKEPEDRYPDANALAEDLRRCLAGEPIDRVRKPLLSPNLWRAALGLTVSSCLLLVLWSGYGLWRERQVEAALTAFDDWDGRDCAGNGCEGSHVLGHYALGLGQGAPPKERALIEQERRLERFGADELQPEHARRLRSALARLGAVRRSLSGRRIQQTSTDPTSRLVAALRDIHAGRPASARRRIAGIFRDPEAPRASARVWVLVWEACLEENPRLSRLCVQELRGLPDGEEERELVLKVLKGAIVGWIERRVDEALVTRDSRGLQEDLMAFSSEVGQALPDGISEPMLVRAKRHALDVLARRIEEERELPLPKQGRSRLFGNPLLALAHVSAQCVAALLHSSPQLPSPGSSIEQLVKDSARNGSAEWALVFEAEAFWGWGWAPPASTWTSNAANSYLNSGQRSGALLAQLRHGPSLTGRMVSSFGSHAPLVNWLARMHPRSRAVRYMQFCLAESGETGVAQIAYLTGLAGAVFEPGLHEDLASDYLADAHVKHAALLWEGGRRDEAERACRAAIGLSTQPAVLRDAYTLLGEIAGPEGLSPEGVSLRFEDLNRIRSRLKAAPRSERNQLRRALFIALLDLAGLHPGSVEEDLLREALRVALNPAWVELVGDAKASQASVRLSTFLRSRGRADEAQVVMTRAVRTLSFDSKALREAIRVSITRGDERGARAFYGRLRLRSPTSRIVATMRAEMEAAGFRVR